MSQVGCMLGEKTHVLENIQMQPDRIMLWY